MIQARVHQGRVEIQEAIPQEWEGLAVKITPLTPDDPLPDLEDRLKAFHALGAVEWDPDERELSAQAMSELNRVSLEAMQRLAR